jgi:probable rRNA maturation factor
MISFNWIETGVGIADEHKTRNWLQLVLTTENFSSGEIAYIFCGDTQLHALNLRFLKHDTYTDILTFPAGSSTETVSGEIYISLDRVLDNASKFQEDPEKELLRIMVHGLLHLCGYDDASPAEKLQMTAKEDYYLNLHP